MNDSFAAEHHVVRDSASVARPVGRRNWSLLAIADNSRPHRALRSEFVAEQMPVRRSTLVDVAASVHVLAGVPASGKSTFGRSLVKRGFYYFSLNGEDAAQRVTPLQQQAWNHYRQGEADALVGALQLPEEPVIVEYGFPPDDGNLAVVRGLRAGGARFVWFDCPAAIARARFQKRERRDRPGLLVASMQAFDRQMGLIETRWDAIVDAADPQIVDVLRDGRAPRSHDSLYAEIFG